MHLEVKMKTASKYLVAVLILSAAVAACSPTADPRVAASSASPTEAVTATPAPAAWTEVSRSRLLDVMGQVNYAGFADAANGIAIGYAGLIRYTSDGGKTWQAGTNTSWCLFGLEFVDPQTAITCGNNLHLRRTINGGNFWMPMHDWGAMEPDQCRYLSFLDSDTGWAARPQAMAATTDGGITWEEIPLESVLKGTEFTPVIAAISRVNADLGYLFTSEGLLYQTGDGGKSWLMVSALSRTFGINPHRGFAPDKAPAVAMRFFDKQNGILVIRRTGVEDFPAGPEYSIVAARTSDGGLTWKTEELSGWKGKFGLFLSRDGKFLTLTDSVMTDVIVLQYQ
jgi:photosystem II stability/assembly factor-like uncharacterized protein